MSGRIIPELDGVRGIAILLVLAFHFGARPPGVPRLFTAPFALGWSGVDLFFVLSGFLITGILMDTKSAPKYLSSFYARRVLRIFPLYLFSVGAYFFVALPLAHQFGHWVDQTASLQSWYWFHVSNWQSAFGRDIGLLTHFWSLAIEEQFYLIWPFVIYMAPRAAIPYVCACTIVASFGLRLFFSGDLLNYPALLFRLTPFRLDTLAFGSLIAAIVRDQGCRSWLTLRWRTIASFSGIAFALVLAIAKTNEPSNQVIATFGFTFLAGLYSMFVFFAFANAGSSGPVLVILRNPLLMAFGKYSYGIYILHFPIAVYAGKLVMWLAQRIPTEIHILLWAGSKVVGIGISFGLAILSWHILEKRFLRLKYRFTAH
ncbi:MAG: acyltransferase [Acidobacteria bacterium]|nr:acyltransferase [Acidobacteriota bacterium]